ncbi:beta-lactamase/transpeptidase-like protein [Paraphoma chrysanthemicola]|uniref:Beta-lactamase/transpeptidase-like protein n=1 Tax=Paraphoma chrysanthemicola TaxID=798071 RepID=A0A8K0W4X2_9PLEO|nr:beta-lactamase/transpeptidase-like protein [Paraphoma chrysanthemicola]
MSDFQTLYEKAREDRILPGYALIAGNKDGEILYSDAKGVASLKEGSTLPFQLDTICSLASMTKLMTAVAALQCVESGLVTLDEDVSKYLPSIGKFGILTGFDNEKNEAITVPHEAPISLRMLLCHTNGHEYDWMSPTIMKWRASRGEGPWSGPTVEDKSTVPLLYEPGTSWRYSHGTDWAGKLIEKVSGKTLDAFMQENIWTPLGINDLTFYPNEKPHMSDRRATISTLSETGEGPAVDAPDFDILFAATDCLGGAGGFGSAEAYFTFLQAVLRRDPKLLRDASFTELFKPQLDERCKKELNDNIKASPLHTQFLGLGLPTNDPKQWSLAGLVNEKGQEGRFSEGTIMWGGVPSMTWFLDLKAGICGTAFCQVIPPMSPSILALHEQFQRGVYQSLSR